MLAQYRTDTRNLLQNPSAPTALYDQTSLDRWINIARRQVAGEAKCIRSLGTLSTVAGQRPYNFSSISTGVAATTGIAGVTNVRQVTLDIASGQQMLYSRSWEWFMQFYLNNPVPQSGVPRRWAQFRQGAAAADGSGATGSLYLDPPPDIAYTLNLDCECFPNTIDDDNDVEAIPYFWTDAVPYLAAYYALLSAQTGQREGEANRMYERYEEWMRRARQAANPAVNTYQYEGAQDPASINKIGMVRAEGGR